MSNTQRHIPQILGISLPIFANYLNTSTESLPTTAPLFTGHLEVVTRLMQCWTSTETSTSEYIKILYKEKSCDNGISIITQYNK